jgi:hypothetical protein
MAMHPFLGRVVAAALLAGLVGSNLVACGGTGEFTAGADNDPGCPETEMDFGGDTTIPADASCTYANLVTDGSIILEPGAYFLVEGGDVGGNLQAAQGSVFDLHDTVVSGDVQVEGASRIDLIESTIGGNLQVTRATGVVAIFQTDVLGDIQFSDCTGDRITLEQSSSGGNLDCTGNTSTIELEGVTVGGEATGQCSEL